MPVVASLLWIHGKMLLFTVIVTILSGCLIMLGHFAANRLAGVPVGAGTIHPAVAAMFFTSLYQDFFQSAYSFKATGAKSLAIHISRITVTVLCIDSLLMCVATAYDYPASRAVMIVAYLLGIYASMKIKRIDAMTVFCYDRADWGPKLGRKKVIMMSLERSTVIATTIFAASFIQFSSNIAVRITASVAACWIQLVLHRTMRMEEVKTGDVHRNIHFNIQFIGTSIARMLIFQDADGSEYGFVLYWTFVGLQILFERLMPRLAMILRKVQKHLRKTDVAPITDNDIETADVDSISVPPREPPESLSLGLDETKNVESGIPLKIRKTIMKIKLPGNIAYALARNDYCFNCYKSTMTVGVIIFLIKAWDGDVWHLAKTFVWKVAAFLGIEVLSESFVMLLELKDVAIPSTLTLSLGYFVIDALASISINNGAIHPAAASILITTLCHEIYRSNYSYFIKGFNGLMIHYSRISTIVLSFMIATLLIGTAFANSSTRILMIVAYEVAVFFTHFLFNLWICESKNALKMYRVVDRSQWGPSIPLKALVIMSVVQSIVVGTTLLAGLFYQFASNIFVRTTASILAGVVQVILRRFVAGTSDEDVARSIKFDIQFIGASLARALIFQNTGSSFDSTANAYFWSFALGQILFERFLPRASILVSLLQNHIRRQENKVEPAENDVGSDDIEAPASQIQLNIPDAPGGRAISRVGTTVSRVGTTKDFSTNFRTTAAKEMTDIILKVEIPENTVYALNRNDYAFTCYKATLTMFLVNFLIKSRFEWTMVSQAITWKCGVFLAAELMTESMLMLFEGKYAIPLESFRHLPWWALVKHWTHVSFYGMMYYSGAAGGGLFGAEKNAQDKQNNSKKEGRSHIATTRDIYNSFSGD
ncbi:hypothetical protein HDU97_004282 [Phlyctochytrium planicorne]|nr:hypothetical protein HDU97_004282 [Phlyctochytrium planicorne]